MTQLLRTLCSVGFVLALAPVAAGADKPKAEKPFSDEMFVKKAADGGMHEVALGKVVSEKGTKPEVKAFAQKMVSDHTKANAELMAAAKAAGIAVPADMSDKMKKETEKFAAMTGTDLDAAYVKHMVKDHEEDVALFTAASEKLKDAGLKAFATKTLPTLKEHLEMVKKLDAKAGGK